MSLTGRKVAVIGLDASGLAACRLLAGLGAQVFALAADGVKPSKNQTIAWSDCDAVLASANDLKDAELAVYSGEVPRQGPVIEKLATLGIPVISDLELATRNFYCLTVGITGTN